MKTVTNTDEDDLEEMKSEDIMCSICNIYKIGVQICKHWKNQEKLRYRNLGAASVRSSGNSVMQE